MARGRFGRRKRSTQNLTQLIVALLREQRQAEDRAAFDAWQNGGEFQGAAMTDDRYLAYIKGRRDSFSKDDPMWDQWNNSVIQTEFSIGEQKAQLAFKEGKWSAGRVAAWYRSQLGSIPKDSAFYRDVAGRAADWAKSAASAARGAAQNAARKAAETQVQANDAIMGQYDALEFALTQEAKRRGLIFGTQSLFDADVTDLQRMFDGLTLGGQPVSYGDWEQAATAKYNALTQQVGAYETLGWKTDGLNEERRKFLDQTVSNINSLDDRRKYELARDFWLDRTAKANGDPFLIDQYTKDYLKSLERLYQTSLGPDGTDANNADFTGALQNEINALNGNPTGPTVMDLMNNSRGTDAEETAGIATGLQNDMALLNEGKAFYGQSEYGGAYGVVLYPANADLDPFGRNGLDDSWQESVVNINGKPTVVRLKGQAVTGATLVDPAGEVVSLTPEMQANIPDLLRQGWSLEASNSAVGFVFQQPNTDTRTYGIYDANGNLQFTSENPFTTGLYPGQDSLVVVGNPLTGPNGQPTKAIDPNSVIDPNAATKPLAIGDDVNPSDLNKLLRSAGQTPLGITPDKAAEYDNWRVDQRNQSRDQQRAAQPDFGPTSQQPDAGVSPAQLFVQAWTQSAQSFMGPLTLPNQSPPQAPTKGPTPPPSKTFAPPIPKAPLGPPAPPPTTISPPTDQWTAMEQYYRNKQPKEPARAVNPKQGITIR